MSLPGAEPEYLSEMSSDDEFHDAEDVECHSDAPGVSWLTRSLQTQHPTGHTRSGDATATETSGAEPLASPGLATHGSLDVSSLMETMPSVELDVGDGEKEEPELATPLRDGPQTQTQTPRAASPSPNGKSQTGTPSTPVPTEDDDETPRTVSPEIPSTAFRLKDLDTGREYLVDEAAADVMIGGRRNHKNDKNDKNIPNSTQSTVVRDLQSGKDVPVKEFEETLGLSPLMREMASRERNANGGGATDDTQSEAASPSNAARVAETNGADDKKQPKPFGRNPRRWVTKRFAAASKYASEGFAAAALGGGDSNDDAPRSPSGSAGNGGADGNGASAYPNPGRGVGSNPAGNNNNVEKVVVNRKMYKEFTEMRRVQTLRAHEEAVWTMKFNRDGRYLATAGQDRVVRVWELDLEEGDVPGDGGDDDTPPTSSPTKESSDGAHTNPVGQKLPMRIKGDAIFKEKPRREYRGHRGDILDLCWSHTDWLLSSSMDKTVRLWYVTMDECLRIFSHQDFVTAIDFHPLNDKYFLSASLDGKLRFWSIPDHRVADWVDIGEMVTAASFNSDGTTAAAGSYKGKCHFYAMDGVRFEYLTHLEVKHSRGGSKKSGKKITGLSFMPGDDRKLLVTSNDSRIRVYDGYSLACKYKGHKNNNSQIRAGFSPGAEFIVCGSEDENVYVWSTVNSFVPSINPIYTGYRRDKHSSYEQFAAQSDITTVALFAPSAVREARTGPVALKIARARDAAKSDIQTSAAAAALFRGGPQSPFSGQGWSPRSNGNGTVGNVSGGQPRSTDGGAELESDPNGDDAEGDEKPTPFDAKRDEARADAAKAKAEGERAFAAGMAIGQIVITAGYSGEIRIFENVGSPQWL